MSHTATPSYLFSRSSHPDLIHVNSLHITFFPIEKDFSEYTYFIITSKQVAKALEQAKVQDLKPALCISHATAQAYRDIGGSVLHIGKGYGDTLSEFIQEYTKETKWLYLRAKEVASHFVEDLQTQGYSIDASILYESCCSKEIAEIQIPSEANLIFTSPSSVVCFLQNNSIPKKARVVVIGKTTAKALPENTNFVIAQNPTIESCIKALRVCLK